MTGSLKHKAGLAFAVVIIAYAVSPYLTLYRLGDAIRRGDAHALEGLVNWDKVREGIAEDICDNFFAQPPAADNQRQSAASADPSALPPFGFSFVRGIASNAIDENVTPAALVSAAQRFQGVTTAGDAPANPPPARANPRVIWAFFDGPTSFSIELLPPGNATGHKPIRIEMEMRRGTWKVTRAWLPTSMLAPNART